MCVVQGLWVTCHAPQKVQGLVQCFTGVEKIFCISAIVLPYRILLLFCAVLQASAKIIVGMYYRQVLLTANAAVVEEVGHSVPWLSYRPVLILVLLLSMTALEAGTMFAKKW